MNTLTADFANAKNILKQKCSNYLLKPKYSSMRNLHREYFKAFVLTQTLEDKQIFDEFDEIFDNAVYYNFVEAFTSKLTIGDTEYVSALLSFFNSIGV